MEKIKISISMIVKNEEAMLARCLESVKDADEIIIVDTGSIDKTKTIALKYTPHVYDFEWNDDFSAARNYAKENCRNEWILSIDADEVLEEGGIQKIKDFLSNYSKNGVGIKMTSIATEFFSVRLFKNLPEVWWNGVIHEATNVIDYDRLDVSITYGSSLAHAIDPKRNLRILEKAVFGNPQNARYLYYLAREQAYKLDWNKAIETFERYLAVATWLPERADAYFMKALCYWKSMQGEKARQSCLMAININANFKAAILLMAEMSFENNANQWKKMAETATDENTLFARKNHTTI